jgi:hypothetical protein
VKRIGATLVVAALAWAEQAGAQPLDHVERDDAMRDAMRAYFRGELQEGAAFLGVGVGTAFIGSSLATRRDDFGIGAASAILPVSAIEIGAGLVLLFRTESQVADLLALHRGSPAQYRAEELPRMQRVNFWFDVYKGIEIGLIALGAGSVVFGAVDDREGFIGAGVGLAAQAGAMLTFDLVAEGRADRYTERIEALTPTVRPVVTPASIGLAGSF